VPSSQTYQVLQQVFGHTSFRPLQSEAVDATLEGRDLLMILPTGGGKSLCYQLPALLKEGVTVVISPLLALMHDQVRALKLQGISAEMISSMQSREEIAEIVQRLRCGEIRLLYVAPERFSAHGFIDLLKSLSVATFVVDEAHCVSEWGHEFREEYRKLHLLKTHFPNVPITAFTATATPQVESDIVRQLSLTEPLILRGSVYRDNLLIRAEPRQGDGKVQLLKFLERFRGESGIVYTFTRNESERIALFLQKEGMKAMAYHAGLPTEVRNRAYHAFVHDEVEVIVATVAFGMGIDKSNIRYVVHTSMPKTLENYYQEIGRAGRDGLPSETLLLYSATDAAQRASLIDGLEEGAYKQSAYDKLEKMVGFCRSEGCRHRQLADYFGESMQACGTKCDNCMQGDVEKEDITEASRKLLSAIYRTGQSFGKNYIIDLLRGSSHQKIIQLRHHELSVYGIGKEFSKVQWDVVVERLMELGALQRGEYRNLVLTPIGVEVLKGQRAVEIRADRLQVQKRPSKRVETPEVVDFDQKVFEHLRAVRKRLADREEVPAYIIFSDKTLKEMAMKRPTTKEQMLKISGVGHVKFERYGDIFIETIKEIEHDNM